MARKNPAAVALGRRGGKARVKNQSPEERRSSARKAAEARWAKVKEEIRQLERDVKALERRAKAGQKARERRK